LIDGVYHVVIRPLASDSEEVLTEFTDSLSDVPSVWSPDGGRILFQRLRFGTTNSNDIWSIDLSTREASPVVEGEGDECQAEFSPDGQSIAYTSDDAGQPDVYLRSLDGKSAPRRISAGGGMFPLWRRDGRELYFVAPGGKVISVPVLSLEPLETGAARRLFTIDSTLLLDDRFIGLSAPIDVTADGERFLVAVGQGGLTPLTLIQNWQALLKVEK
jgi:Tol biopolymer transport system component